MTRSYSRFLALGIACILFLTIPAVAGVDQQLINENDDDPIFNSILWTEDITVQVTRYGPSEQPWWEITTRDMNRNRIVDYLETVPESEDFPIVVSYSHTPGAADVALLMQFGLKSGYIIESIDAISVGPADPTKFSDLAKLPGVVMIEPAGTIQLLSDVATRALKARGSDEYSPYSAWELTNVTGYGINIAVVDTGIDDGHPSLEGKRVAGYDAVTPGARTDGDDNPDDRNGHGTSCSGMATGTSKGDPDLAYMGAAPGAGLIDVQIGTDVGAGPFENYLLPTIYHDSAIIGLEWVRDNADTEWSWTTPEHFGIDVMSLSWGITSHENGGSDGSDPFSRVIDEIVDEGVVCVGAAGNDGPNNDGLSGMSAASKAVIIGATNDINTIDRTDDIIAPYSSRGPRRDDNDGYPYDELKPDVSAPGTNIWNTDPCTTSEGCYGDAEDGGYEARGSGTSYATPAVAGVVALILDANPDLTPAQVTEILHLTSERRGPATYPDIDPFWNKDFGYGMVDAYEAVKLAIEMRDAETDLDTVDVELQAHITNITELASGGAVIEGLAFAKIGTVERVEISIDGKEWKEVQYQVPINGSGEEVEFVNWMYEVKSSELSFTGNHTVTVRAVTNDLYSLPDSAEFFGKKGESDDDGIWSSQMGLASALILLALIVLVVVMARKKDENDEEEELDQVQWTTQDEKPVTDHKLDAKDLGLDD